MGSLPGLHYGKVFQLPESIVKLSEMINTTLHLLAHHIPNKLMLLKLGPQCAALNTPY